MQSKIRHDLSDPIAMVAMITSALTDLSADLDEEVIGRFRREISSELKRAEDLFARYETAVDLQEMGRAVERFLESPDSATGSALQKECARLIEVLGNGTTPASS